MVEIIFEAHGTTFDNEDHLSSGFYDIELSPLGKQQSKELGERYKKEKFDVIFCSDLQRSYKSAQIAFGNKYPIIKDSRLRECDYGDLTRSPSEKVEVEKINRINKPFPNGESYTQTNERIKSFLEDLIKNYNGNKIMIIGHRATQYGLDYWINNKSLKESLSSKFKWQPGWLYKLNSL
jgi:broad specificity phosphatase PhoE